MPSFLFFKPTKPRLILALLTISTVTVAAFTLIKSDSLFAQGNTQMTQSSNKHQLAADQFKQALAKTEANYTLVYTKAGFMDKKPVYLYRYQAVDTPSVNLGGTHVSIVVDEQNRLKGLARMNSEPKNTPLPTKEQTKKIAQVFLTQYAADLLNGAELQWVKAHDETLLNAQGKKVKQTGMKAKYRNTISGLYFWVIVDSDNEVMIFERDIEWDFMHAGRKTEKWLHDDYLKKQML